MRPFGCVLSFLRFCHHANDSQHSVEPGLSNDDLRDLALMKKKRELAKLHLDHIKWKFTNKIPISEHTFDEWLATQDKDVPRQGQSNVPKGH